MTVRAARPADESLLDRLRRSIREPGDRYPERPAGWLAALLAGGGRAWLLTVNNENHRGVPAGCATVAPVPGLPGLMELAGGILPAWRRRGLGTKLLHSLLRALAGSQVHQLSYPVTDLDGPAACFLRRQGFFEEHREIRLALNVERPMPPLPLPAGFSWATFPPAETARHFRHLYDAAFTGRPWYQPYDADEDVLAELLDPSAILFLCAGRVPVGFAWTRHLKSGLAEIEPLGLDPAYQGQGLGRLLLNGAIRRLAAVGAQRIQLGAWEENDVALNLYRVSGFVPLQATTYLAYDLPGSLNGR